METEAILPLADKARDAWINIDTIGFGDPNGYDKNLLLMISSRIHSEKFVPVQSLRELSAALITSASGQQGAAAATSRGIHHPGGGLFRLDDLANPFRKFSLTIKLAPQR